MNPRCLLLLMLTFASKRTVWVHASAGRHPHSATVARNFDILERERSIRNIDGLNTNQKIIAVNPSLVRFPKCGLHFQVSGQIRTNKREPEIEKVAPRTLSYWMKRYKYYWIATLLFLLLKTVLRSSSDCSCSGSWSRW